MCNLNKGPSRDAPYQASDYMVKRFQRRFFQKSTNQKQELPVAAMFVNRSGQNAQSLQMTFHRCFLPSFIFIWPSGCREDFQKLTNKKQELPVVAMFINESRRNVHIFIEDLPQMLSTKFRFIWPSSFRGEDLKKSANHKQELPVVAMFVNRSGQNEHSL